MKVFVVTGMTESGDDLEPLVFAEKPSDDQIQEELKDILGEEYEYVSWTRVTETTLL